MSPGQCYSNFIRELVYTKHVCVTISWSGNDLRSPRRPLRGLSEAKDLYSVKSWDNMHSIKVVNLTFLRSEHFHCAVGSPSPELPLPRTEPVPVNTNSAVPAWAPTVLSVPMSHGFGDLLVSRPFL